MKSIKYTTLLLFVILFAQDNISLINPLIITHERDQELSLSNQPLGRDKDPKVVTNISKFILFSRKVVWTTLNIPGMRFMTKLLFPKSTISYIDTNQKIVAFSIDDGFCGLDNPNGNMINEVRELFDKYNSKATFFVTGSHCNYNLFSDVQLLLNDKHEIANHSMYDWPYNKYSKEEFKYDFEQTNSILNEFTNDIPNWYRAPHAKLSKEMQEVLDEKDYTHIVCDVFANDTSIPDSNWISKFILKRTKPGSILLIHMPERGVREWNYKAMELTLIGLKQMGYKVVTISELHDLSNNKK
jgi:chitin deacetylase